MATTDSSAGAQVTQELQSFQLPAFCDNPNGWGPCSVPDQYKDVPFLPFSKSDRLGRVSDWNVVYRPGEARPQFGGLYPNSKEDDQSAFSLVDNRPKPKPRFRGGYRPRGMNYAANRRGMSNQRGGRGGWGNFRGGRGGQQQNSGWQQSGRGGKNRNQNQNGMRGGFNGRGRWGFNRDNRQPENRESSVEVKSDWKLIEDLEFDTLRGLVYTVNEPEELTSCGVLEKYEASIDRVSPKQPLNLQRFENRQHFTATTSEDPVLQRLAKAKAGNVYATDTILGLLMTATLSVNSWDVIVRKEGDSVFIDKRPNSRIDYLTVNENWNESQQSDKDSVNHPIKLSDEATFINHNFSQQVLSKSETHAFKEENPFAGATSEGSEPASLAYRYRKWTFGDVKLVSRCTLNAFTMRKDKKMFLTVRALNEFDSKLSGNVDYRQKLESQSGAVLSSEMKNNANKLARWTAETVLSGADEIKLGFVSRVYSKNNFRHTILMTQRYTPLAFSTSINVKIRSLWGCLKAILDACLKLEDGKYLLLKDANKSVLHLYSVSGDSLDELASS